MRASTPNSNNNQDDDSNSSVQTGRDGNETEIANRNPARTEAPRHARSIIPFMVPTNELPMSMIPMHTLRAILNDGGTADVFSGCLSDVRRTEMLFLPAATPPSLMLPQGLRRSRHSQSEEERAKRQKRIIDAALAIVRGEDDGDDENLRQ